MGEGGTSAAVKARVTSTGSRNAEIFFAGAENTHIKTTTITKYVGSAFLQQIGPALGSRILQ